MADKPFQQKCSNAGFADHWTCPGCYADLPAARPGDYNCPECRRPVRLSVEYEPVSVAELIGGEE